MANDANDSTLGQMGKMFACVIRARCGVLFTFVAFRFFGVAVLTHILGGLLWCCLLFAPSKWCCSLLLPLVLSDLCVCLVGGGLSPI